MLQFNIIKNFNLNCHLRVGISIVELLRQPPTCNWIKCNSDGTTNDNFDLASCGGIFGDSSGTSLSISIVELLRRPLLAIGYNVILTGLLTIILIWLLVVVYLEFLAAPLLVVLLSILDLRMPFMLNLLVL